MYLLEEILQTLQQIAPLEMALPDDPIGLLIGDSKAKPIAKIGVALDATVSCAQRAAAARVDLLVTHHPLIYRPLKTIVTEGDPIATVVAALIKADIALFAMHTNWDRVSGGINDTLADLLGLRGTQTLSEHGELALPRMGSLPSPLRLRDFTRLVEETLGCSGMCALRVNDLDPDTIITQVAVCGGAGASLAAQIQSLGADAYVTSDVRHHEFIDATDRGLAVLDAGHRTTETPGMRRVMELLSEKLPKAEVVWCGE